MHLGCNDGAHNEAEMLEICSKSNVKSDRNQGPSIQCGSGKLGGLGPLALPERHPLHYPASIYAGPCFTIHFGMIAPQFGRRRRVRSVLLPIRTMKTGFAMELVKGDHFRARQRAWLEAKRRNSIRNPLFSPASPSRRTVLSFLGILDCYQKMSLLILTQMQL